VVDDGRTRRLQQHARRFGHTDLRGYLQARCDAGYSVPALAEELGESEWTIGQALATQRITLSFRREQLVGELGFADVRAYLQDRLIRREWLLADVAAELGAPGHGAAPDVAGRRAAGAADRQAGGGGQAGAPGAVGGLAGAAGRAWVCGSGALPTPAVRGAGGVDHPDAGRTAGGHNWLVDQIVRLGLR
jgi:hypothetical protein